MKEFKREMQEKDYNRSQKKKHVEENLNDLTLHSEEVYKEHLIQVKEYQEEKLKRQKEMCALEYRRHSESVNKSFNNYNSSLKERHNLELVTERNLQDLQRRLSLGFTRSQQRKEELRSHAADTLQNFHNVLEVHEKLEFEADSERLAKYLERRKK